jgi:succinoglycan biosynthesis protein ExoL
MVNAVDAAWLARFLSKAHRLQAGTRMTRVAFFGHDAADAAVRRRVQGFRDDGLEVIGFMMRRKDEVEIDWENVDLGRTFDAAYGQRIGSILAGAKSAALEKGKLASASVIYARNLDMLATAFLAKHHAGLNTPVIYEALDIHRLLTRKDLIGLAFRRIEAMLLSRSRRLVVSSPGFLENHFDVHHRGRFQARLIENRLAAGADYGPRPARGRSDPTGGRPLRVGWVGVLRCWRSFGLLLELARRFEKDVRIVMHGAPALTEIPDFHHRIQGLANVEFHGRYKAPEDLARIYSGLDVVWAGDFMEAGYNSAWLLPNRLYEGGYYAVPPIAPVGTQTATWIEDRQVGFTVEESLAEMLPALVEKLIADREPIEQRRERLLDLPASTFVQPRGELSTLIEDALRDSTGTAPSELPQSSTTRTRNSVQTGSSAAAAGE